MNKPTVGQAAWVNEGGRWHETAVAKVGRSLLTLADGSVFRSSDDSWIDESRHGHRLVVTFDRSIMEAAVWLSENHQMVVFAVSGCTDVVLLKRISDMLAPLVSA